MAARQIRTLMLLTSAAALGAVLSAGACFIEPAAPSTFRFECSSDSECDADERCSSGLCQQPCGGQDDADCGQEAPICLNGYCASICPVDDDVCPDPQECMSLAVSGEDPGESGVCAVACSDANPCAEGELCYEELGLCVQTCMTAADCGSGEDCVVGLCVPTDAGGGPP